MKLLSSILFLLILISFFFFSIINFASASNLNLSDIETQITPESSKDKIKKLQTFFKDLWLYNGSIDSKYESIKDDIIDYQIKSWIIKNKEDWWAWYFWKKTIASLKKDFNYKFNNSKEIIKKEKPTLWEKNFIVTAYYSPLPNQKKYITWTYRWDKRLNWNWKITASWKKVFTWLLAAPRNYDFWTKIYFEWIWVWVVEDRWWAIVNSGERWYEHDRIDIWVWHWDEWLARAIKWWKRTVKWKIVSDDINLNIEFSPQIISESFSISPNSTSSDVKKLQVLFKYLWLYDGVLDWNYSSIKDDLIDYQVSAWVIISKSSDDAWYFWSKTIASIRKDYKIRNIFIEKFLEEENNKFLLSSKEKKKIESISKKIISYVDKKSNWDNLRKKKYLYNLKNKLDKYIDKTKGTKKKRQLKYLKSII